MPASPTRPARSTTVVLAQRRMVCRIVWLLALALTAVGCGGDDRQPESVSWRNVTLDLPDDWYLVERGETHLSIANRDIGAPAESDEPRARPEGDVVAMYFTYEPETLPDDWREFVEEQDATLESDEPIVVGENVPATRLIYSYVTDGTPTREMVVLIPSRALVVLAQPIPRRGASDAPQVFLEYVEVFLEVLRDAEYGAPVLE